MIIMIRNKICSILFQHPEYEYDLFKGLPNDVALLQSSEPVNTENNAFISLIPMANMEDDFEGHDAIISGWGRLSGKC